MPRPAGFRACRITLQFTFPAVALHRATPCGATGWKAIHEWIQGPGPTMPDRFMCRKTCGVHPRPGICRIRDIMIMVDHDRRHLR